MVNVNKIRELAKEKGITMAFICNRLGMARNYILDIERGQNTISDERLQIVADLLDTTPAYLKDEINIKEKPAAPLTKAAILAYVKRAFDGVPCDRLA